jgi:hypothetical protein
MFHLEELVRASTVIVFATVADVSEVAGQNETHLVATARVSEVLKGPSMRTVQFRASRGENMDDASSATEGDSVLLFLDGPYQGNYVIAYLGRGYMPLREMYGSQYATYWRELILPKDAQVVPGPEPSSGRRNVVPISYLKRLIVEYLHGPAAA